MKQKLQITQKLISDLCESYTELGLGDAETEDQIHLREGMVGLHTQISQVVPASPKPDAGLADSVQVSSDVFQGLLQKYSEMLVHTVKEKLHNDGKP